MWGKYLSETHIAGIMDAKNNYLDITMGIVLEYIPIMAVKVFGYNDNTKILIVLKDIHYALEDEKKWHILIDMVHLYFRGYDMAELKENKKHLDRVVTDLVKKQIHIIIATRNENWYAKNISLKRAEHINIHTILNSADFFTE